MSHRRKRNAERRQQAIRAEAARSRAIRQHSTSRNAIRLLGRGIGETVRQTNQFALLALGVFSVAQAAIPWTSSLIDRAVPALYGLGFLAGLTLYRRLVRW